MASETHFPLARVLECPRQSWLDQDDGRIGPDHSSDLVSGTGIPQVGPCDCQGSLTICGSFDLALDNVVTKPKCGSMELGTEPSSGAGSSRWFVRRRSARNTEACALSRPVSGAGGGYKAARGAKMQTPFLAMSLPARDDNCSRGGNVSACGDLVAALPGGCP